jgi:hypothetical protein
MTSELSNFGARLREGILSEGRVARGPDLGNSNIKRDSCNSSLGRDEVFNALALKLFALQFAHNAAYRKISEARSVTPRSVSHWSQIPAVPAAAFKELELTCLPPAERTHVFYSSGTTEQHPSQHFHNAESLAIYEDSLWTWFERHPLHDLKSEISNLRLAILTPPPEQAPRSSLVHMFETIRQRLDAPASDFIGRTDPDGAWTLDFDAALARLATASQTPETKLIVLGTAFSFVHLVDFLTEQNLRFQLPPGSRVMETGGYKGRSRTLPKAELHALIKEKLGVPPSQIVCEYGMSELSSQAYDNASHETDVALPAHEAPPHPALSPDGGEGGLWPGEGEVRGAGGRRPGEGVEPNLQAHRSSARHFQFPPWARVQIVSPETGREVAEGETGLIRVFDLANVFSVMAIQTEDLSVRCGEGFELIGRAELAEPRGCSLMAV